MIFYNVINKTWNLCKMIRKDCKTTIPAVAMDGLLSSPGGQVVRGPMDHSPCLKWLLTFLVRRSIKLLQRYTKPPQRDKMPINDTTASVALMSEGCGGLSHICPRGPLSHDPPMPEFHHRHIPPNIRKKASVLELMSVSTIAVIFLASRNNVVIWNCSVTRKPV